MPKTLKIILILPKKDDPLSWAKPVAILKQKSQTDYELPLVIEDTRSYPFDCKAEGRVEANEILMREIMMAAAQEFGNEGAKAFESKWGDIYQVHKTEHVAYFMFARFFEPEWLEGTHGSFRAQGKPICVAHSEILQIQAEYKQYLRSIARYSVPEKTGRNNLSGDDLEALCKACKYFARMQKQSHGVWGDRAMKTSTII